MLLGQSILQALNFITGFLLVRWLSIESYAQFGVVFGFQSTLAMLIDLGFGGCIVSLVGNRNDRPEVIGGYIAAAHWFRTRLFAVVVPFSAVAFFLIGRKHGWNLVDEVLLFGCIVAALASQGRISWYSAPLVIHHRIGRLYRVQNFAAVVRLVTSLLLHVAGWLSAVTATIINTAVSAWMAVLYTREAQPYVQIPSYADRKVRKEMLHYLAPLIPGIAFTALQGQLIVLLISIFGKTQNIAEVAALGRLAQFFILLSAFNTTLIEPYFARLNRARLLSRYLLVVGTATLLGTAIALTAFIFPQPLLWILGHKYEHLDLELGWMMAGACLGYIGSTMWTIHAARKWIYWWGSLLYIVLVSSLQAVFIAFWDLSTTLSVLYLNLATNLVILAVHAVTALVSFMRENRATEEGSALEEINR